ncbi:hypothetical protein ACFLVA_00920 [Chloroflexota bacterium]
MKWRKWFEKWGMTSLKIKSPFLEADLRWKDADKAAAWEMYIELLTRITTQPLDTEHGDEKNSSGKRLFSFSYYQASAKK